MSSVSFLCFNCGAQVIRTVVDQQHTLQVTSKFLDTLYRHQTSRLKSVNGIISQSELMHIVHDSLLISSISPEVKSAFSSFVLKNFGKTESGKMQSLLNSNDPRRVMSLLLDAKIQSFKSLAGNVHGLNNHKFLDATGFKLQAEGVFTLSDTAFKQYRSNTYMSGKVAIAGINFKMQSNFMPENDMESMGFQKFHTKLTYDREGFLKSLKQHVQQNYNLSTLFLQDVNVENYMTKFTQAAILSQLKGLQNKLPESLMELLKDSLHFQHIMQ